MGMGRRWGEVTPLAYMPVRCATEAEAGGELTHYLQSTSTQKTLRREQMVPCTASVYCTSVTWLICGLSLDSPVLCSHRQRRTALTLHLNCCKLWILKLSICCQVHLHLTTELWHSVLKGLIKHWKWLLSFFALGQNESGVAVHNGRIYLVGGYSIWTNEPLACIQVSDLGFF